MQAKHWLLVALGLLLTGWHGPALATQDRELAKFGAGDYWRDQALLEIIPFWIPTVDHKNGGYFTDVQNDGTIGKNPLKYPRMVSRLVYGFSTAYLLSGDPQYLDLAKHGLDYLRDFGWDHQYGGWYTELDADNRPTVATKDLFDQTYGNLGPVFYFYVTGDRDALQWVEKTHQLLKTKAWDRQFGGYYALVNRDWTVTETDKSFNSQVDTATAYLIYDYLVTRDPALLEDLKAIGGVIMRHMYDPKTGYIREQFDRQWNFIDNYLGHDQIDVGHNLKTAWVLLRLYQLTGQTQYLEFAQKIAATMTATAWDKRYYGWYFSKNVHRPAQGPNEKSKCWWTQTEGNFMMLNLYRITKDRQYLDYFQKTSAFWDRHLVDHVHKEVYSYVSESGQPRPNSLKGNLYKSGYHSMEHALMNYLYTRLYVQRGTADLYFRLSTATDGVKHYVTIIEDPKVFIAKVTIDGKPWQDYDENRGYIVLPKGEALKVKVTLGIRPE